MARVTVDTEYLIIELLKQALPNVWVTSEADVDGIDHIPMITVRARNGRMVSNGGPFLAWDWDIFLGILEYGIEECSDLADQVYVLMHQFHDNGAGIEGVGSINYTDDISMPARTATTEVPAGGLTQFDGSWSVTVRN